MSGAAFSMFYILSKVVFFVIAPSHLCLIAVGLGLALQIWTAWQSFGRKLAVIGFVGIVVLG
ncbi:MAG: hypothetical protein AAF709_18700, partial [Pseudomonadota bacterium]